MEYEFMGKFKQQKLYEGQKVGEKEDIISNLPDCILHHILSFLPTKDAVAFCMSSTRWKHLWTTLPNIDFDDLCISEEHDWSENEEICYVHFVERVYVLYNMSNLKKFRLSCRVFFDASRVEDWVSTATGHKVQELNLCFFVNEDFRLHRGVFTCETLTALQIEMNCVLELPSCISFPCLKSLHLRLVTFSDDSSTQRLFCSCPVLQELAILDCEWMNLKSITVAIPTLKSLTIVELPCFGSMDYLNDCEIQIYAANLSSFWYSGNLSNDIFLYNLSSLVFASIDIPNLCESQTEIARRGVKLLRGVHIAKSLRMSNGTIKSFFLAENFVDYFPIFQNLNHLELNVEIENHTVGALMDLFQSLPNLESIVFAKGFGPHFYVGAVDWSLKLASKCFLSHLKRVNLWNFHGNDAEMCFLDFLMKYACVLKTMNIYYSKNLSGGPKKQKSISSQLKMLSRGSKGCIIALL